MQAKCRYGVCTTHRPPDPATADLNGSRASQSIHRLRVSGTNYFTRTGLQIAYFSSLKLFATTNASGLFLKQNLTVSNIIRRLIYHPSETGSGMPFSYV